MKANVKQPVHEKSSMKTHIEFPAMQNVRVESDGLYLSNDFRFSAAATSPDDVEEKLKEMRIAFNRVNNADGSVTFWFRKRLDV